MRHSYDTIRGCRRYQYLVKFCLLFLFITWLISLGLLNIYEIKDIPEQVICTETIQSLCSDYRSNLLTGNLCPLICNQINSFSQYECMQGDGNKIVMIFHSNKKERWVLKTKNQFSNNYEVVTDAPYRTPYMDYETARNHLKEISTNYFSSESIRDLFLAHVSLNPMSNHTAIEASVSSGKSLLQQPEYISLMRFQNLEIGTKLLGTCGHFYATEYAPQHETIASTIWSGLPWTPLGVWSQRREAAISLIELAEKLDLNNLHMCDVKGSNFGWLEDGKAVLIDMDTLFTKEELALTIQGTRCYTDYDCSFWDCHGVCDWRNLTCTGQASNTNFHAICQKIFVHHSSNAFHGLLSQVPAKRNVILQQIKDWCRGWSLTDATSRTVLSSVRRQLLIDQILG